MTAESTSFSRTAVMNYLNEATADYPAATSFASGRPAEQFFDPKMWNEAISGFLQWQATQSGSEVRAAAQLLAQYGRTAGMINCLVAQNLRHDQGIDCDARRVMVTAGCQEALALSIQTLCKDSDDVVLARNPTYIGVTGVADLSKIPLIGIDAAEGEGFPAALERSLAETRLRRQCPRALYLIPDFDNPTGTVLSLAEREAVLKICAEHRVVILEDNPYGMFRFEGERLLPLAALDRAGCVIYLGTFSKTLFPSVRVGCLVLPEALFGDSAASAALMHELAERKSFLTVNTSQLNQALVGGVLLNQSCSLTGLIQPALEFYRRNRDQMISVLTDCLGDTDVRWNTPAGGFFMSLHLPFEFQAEEMKACARDDQVLVMPMTFFSLDASWRSSVRIAFSNVSPDRIEAGVQRLSSFIKRQLARG